MPLNLEKIRELREKKGWSYADAAKAAGMNHRQYWYAIETGDRHNVTVEMLEKIAKALGVGAGDLLKR